MFTRDINPADEPYLSGMFDCLTELRLTKDEAARAQIINRMDTMRGHLSITAKTRKQS